MQDQRLRIITLNTWKGDGAYRKRVELAAQQLGQLAPDILCLQEVLVTEDGTYNTARQLASALDLDIVYAPARKKTREVEEQQYICESGLAVLTNWQVRGSKVTLLPSSDCDPGRICLTVDLEKDSVFVRVVNCHLTHIRKDRELRMKQLQYALNDSIGNGVDTHLQFCCGDLNLTLQPDDRAAIEKAIGQNVDDCYLLGGGESPGYTLRKLCGESVGRRIDYILALQGNTDNSFTCSHAKVVLDNPDEDGVFASDHCGVLVDYRI